MKIDYVCKHCGSNDIERSATVKWSALSQSWVVTHVYDEDYCLNCENHTQTETTQIGE